MAAPEQGGLMANGFTESEVEDAALTWFEELGYTHIHGPDIADDGPTPERSSYQDVVLEGRLRGALTALNPTIPADALDEALRKVTRPENPSLPANNRAFHQMLVDGAPVEYQRPDGTVAGDRARLVDFDDPDANDWLAVNQFTVVEGQHNRRPDVVVFVNGLPLAVIELKNAADENATIWSAWSQLQTYKEQIPSLFVFNEALLISDGLEARIGSLSADKERFMPWRTIEGEELAPTTVPQLEVLLHGVFEKQRLLQLLRHYIVFEDEGGGKLIKKMAGYHQFHAVERAVAATREAARPEGNRKVGVVWHTQGSGKSLTMAFYAGRVVLDPVMENPTLVVLTDRNDLDDQLFGTFALCKDLLRQVPGHAESRAQLRELLSVASGGVVFTTIQKFLPEEKGDTFPALSDRHNIVVIADEAHRSQYGFRGRLNQKTGEIEYGFAKHLRDSLPNASYIGFTGTPIEKEDKDTRAVFGEYISIYDIQRAVDDRATVPIYYESRLAKLALDEAELPQLDPEFEEATEGEEIERKEKLKTKWAALEALVGSEKRLAVIARDIVAHFDQRQEVPELAGGKAMIVCMSRRICVELYRALITLHPDAHADDDDRGTIKVVMTGSASDPVDWQGHIRNKARRDAIAKRFRDPSDPLQIVLVRDMWLTGFDVPCLHTMYLDKPMRGHTLMQAIARVNRVFKDKPGGLVVDYIGIGHELKQALANYTQSGGKGEGTVDQAEAVAVMQEKFEVCCQLFFGFDWSAWGSGEPAVRLGLLPAALEHVLAQEDGKKRFLKIVTELSKAFALAMPHAEAEAIREDVVFFQAVRAGLVKASEPGQRSSEDIELAIEQMVSRAVIPGGVIDIFAAAGLEKPDLSILSDEFLAEVRDLPHKNLAVELLRKLLNDELKTRSKRNVVQARSFAEMLERQLRAYQNRAIETVEVIEELIKIARAMREAGARGEALGLTDDELAFYDALEVSDSAVEVLGDEKLKLIAHELVDSVRRNTTIDWTVKESVRARLRVLVKRILRKYGYPPDLQEKATQTVLEQAEVLCADWVGG